MKVVHLATNELTALIRSFGLKTLFKFLFKPMYGYTDIVSRFISLYVRIGHFFLLSVASFLYSIALFTFVLIWVLIPPFVLFNILFHAGVFADGPVTIMSGLF